MKLNETHAKPRRRKEEIFAALREAVTGIPEEPRNLTIQVSTYALYQTKSHKNLESMGAIYELIIPFGKDFWL